MFTLPITQFFYKASLQDRLFFTKHLATMIKAGISLSEALHILHDQTKSIVLHRMIGQIHHDILNGSTFTDALRKHPEMFDALYIHMVEISEVSGTLEKNLEFLAVQLGKQAVLRQKIQSASLYPALVFFATFGMGGFISLFVLPKLVDFFQAFDIDLPLSTRVLLWFANLMKNWGIFIVVLGILGMILFFFLLHIRVLKTLWHAVVLRIPFIGTLVVYGQLAQFCRNFGVLVQSGVPVAKSLETAAVTLSNLTFMNDVQQTAKTLMKGKEIGKTIEQKKFHEFPILVSRMISIGEKTGRLDEVLLYLGDYYEEEIDYIAKNFSTILEPILLLGVGFLVGFVAIAIISPIYELTGSIR